MEQFITIKDVAEKWGITPRRVQKMCADGRITGAKKFGRDWAIPIDVEKPIDKRLTTGIYKGWRNKPVKKETENISVHEG